MSKLIVDDGIIYSLYMYILLCKISYCAKYFNAKYIIVQNTSKTYHYSLFHPKGIFRW